MFQWSSNLISRYFLRSFVDIQLDEPSCECKDNQTSEDNTMDIISSRAIV